MLAASPLLMTTYDKPMNYSELQFTGGQADRFLDRAHVRDGCWPVDLERHLVLHARSHGGVLLPHATCIPPPLPGALRAVVEGWASFVRVDFAEPVEEMKRL